MTSVLISGAGVAGPTLASLLARHGFLPTVIERSQGLRSSGNPVDVRGAAIPVAHSLGIMRTLEAAGTSVTGLAFVDGDGRTISRVSTRAVRDGVEEVELPRGDLARILYEASRDTAEFIFDDTIVSLSQDSAGVDVTFDRSAPRRFDLVIGSDGLHSTTRRLVFGPESGFVRHLGMFIATVPVGSPPDNLDDVVMHNTPGRAVSIHPVRGDALAAFMFRAPLPADFDHRDLGQHKRLIIDAFQGDGWRVPELLDRVRAADDLYFDSVSQVRLPSWSQGRIALLGDAASCVSLFGDGSTMAMSGAATLAAALADDPSDHSKAFRVYEDKHRRLIDPKQRRMSMAAGLLVPRSRAGIAGRNLLARFMR
jgi:2-polyprenyl-6-methoxyphenol hydroxylase-like FAD-dependent oxidoreductase